MKETLTLPPTVPSPPAPSKKSNMHVDGSFHVLEQMANVWGHWEAQSEIVLLIGTCHPPNWLQVGCTHWAALQWKHWVLGRLSVSLLHVVKADRALGDCIQMLPPSGSNRRHFRFSVLLGGLANTFLFIWGHVLGKQSLHCVCQTCIRTQTKLMFTSSSKCLLCLKCLLEAIQCPSM